MAFKCSIYMHILLLEKNKALPTKLVSLTPNFGNLHNRPRAAGWLGQSEGLPDPCLVEVEVRVHGAMNLSPPGLTARKENAAMLLCTVSSQVLNPSARPAGVE